MSKRWVRAIPLFILLVSIIGAVVYSESMKQRAAVGQSAPGFTLEDLTGESVSLSDFAGRVVFINFWTTWCDACREETPALQAFYERYGDKVVQLGINLREPVDKIKTFMEEFRATYPVLRDKDARVSERYRIKGVPESWFIDGEGIARVYHIGPLTFEQMQQAYETTTGEPIDGNRVPGQGGSPYTLSFNRQSDILYLGSRNGLLVSTEEGARWDAASLSGLPFETARLWTAQDGQVLYATGREGGLAVSRDAGGTWGRVGPTNERIDSLAVGPEGRRAYAWVPGEGLYGSDDSGATWAGPSTALPVQLERVSLAVDLNNPMLLWAGTPAGLLMSWDRGATWQTTAIEERVFGISGSPERPWRLYLATNHGVWVTDDQGATATWLKGSSARRMDDVIALAASVGDILFAVGTNGDVYRSEDGGVQWRLLNWRDDDVR